ncbi:ribosomal large subunit pseudouridine synthase D [Thermanaeromonas toyohensis ToBE]|uniref:Pseudouridine synthase n=1 Tax=Thermanaeromonas toyohensis ToBE TaxID=698762 RepID=A0A1W1VME9_9FIRM|nr:RluA family pseudouridine synthase [Thermanaeromonas toyohensis]SMB94463.1 ribosomal large subunit pseudouridine synthase D [Thermanaeromonas toyohensis ToBE]
MTGRFSLEVGPEEAGKRLDVWLTEKLTGVSRTRIQHLLEEGLILVDGKIAKANHKVRPGQRIWGEIPPPRSLKAQPEPLPLDIVYEDEDLIVVNKPQGMVVHPAPGNESGTLVNALLYHCGDLSGIGGALRPGIVHRLDKDTSGLLVAAKNDFAHRSLAAQIKARQVKRVYLALVYGEIKEPAGKIEAPIGRHPVDRQRMAVTFKNSRPAITHYRVLKRFPGFTFLEVHLETGRTHQIRVHMAYLGHPVVGDVLYGPKKQAFEVPGQLLHAGKLGFYHPRTGDYLEFTAPLPPAFVRVLDLLSA